jgi:capsular exopolysaccharide synthesis family protein
MRRPRIHTIFGLTNRVGLSVLFRGNSTLRSVMRPVEGVEGVFVITSGNIPPNPTELLASGRMDQILHEASREVDLVIIDSPPSLVADFQVLAAKADGVLLVVQPGHTRADSAVATLEQLQRVNARTLGVVLNKIPRSSYYYGGYHHYYYPYQRGAYYYQHEESQPQLEGQSMRMLPPARQTHVYYPPQNEFEEHYYVKDTSANPAAQLGHAEDQNEITQPRPAVNPGAKKVDTQEHPPVIEILPPLTFTPYEGNEDE